jgi:type III secretion protein R
MKPERRSAGFPRGAASGGAGLALLAVLLAAGEAAAQGESAGEAATRPVTLIVALAAFSLVPFVLMTATSYVKISVVLNVLRNALGAQQVPPASVTSAVAVILTLYVMYPTIEECRAKAAPLLESESGEELLSKESAAKLLETARAVKEPMTAFLGRNASASSVHLFMSLARAKMGGSATTAPPSEKDLRILLPSFLITELEEAFFIGFLIFLPFLIIELVISNILLSLGMHMLSPTTISLPFKLLLFVSVSGWEILSRGLIMGYG